jgi:hypothetical protein
VTINNVAGAYGFCSRNEYNITPLTRNNWRASLVPAAAVIPAPIAYIKVVAVKKLFFAKTPCALNWVGEGFATFTLKKLECSKQAIAWISQHGIIE